MKTKQILSITALSFVLMAQYGFAGTNFQYSAPANNGVYNSFGNNLQGYALYVPAGATCSVVLSQELNSKTATLGSNVNAILAEDFMYNNTLIAAAGSTVSGTITKAKKAGLSNRNGQIQVKFTTITTPYNNVIPISAVIVTDDSSGILKGGTKKEAVKEYAKDAVIGSGAGAVLGTAMGAMSGGSVGRGAIYGTALGGGIGVVKAVANKGSDFSIPANSQLNIVFDQPITLGAQ